MSQERIREMERRLEAMRRDLAEVRDLATEAHQMYPRAWARNPTGGGESTRLHWARVPTGGVDPATGTFAALSPTSFVSDVYRGGASWTLVAEDATVYWHYFDGADGGSLVPCLPNGDGSYSADTNSCTPIPEGP